MSILCSHPASLTRADVSIVARAAGYSVGLSVLFNAPAKETPGGDCRDDLLFNIGPSGETAHLVRLVAWFIEHPLPISWLHL